MGKLCDVGTPPISNNVSLPPTPTFSTYSQSQSDSSYSTSSEETIKASNPNLDKYTILDQMDDRRNLALRFKTLNKKAQLKILENPEIKAEIEAHPDLFGLSTSLPSQTSAAIEDNAGSRIGIGDESFKRNLRRRLKK